MRTVFFAVMFYYRPYVVGCGAEGEFNLVLDYPWP